jgi:hypothetical protein
MNFNEKCPNRYPDFAMQAAFFLLPPRQYSIQVFEITVMDDDRASALFSRFYHDFRTEFCGKLFL